MVLFAIPAFAAHTYEDYSIAVLQGLDKPNARVQTFEVKVGDDASLGASFGPLIVHARSCKKTPPEETPEAVAFLEIEDTRIKETDARTLFRGWMFASSPALSAMEHPVYDVWVLDCKNADTKANASPASAAAGDAAASSAKKAAAPDKAKRKR